MKTVLVVDSVPATPHTETSLELLYRAAEDGRRVVFFPAYLSGLGIEWPERSRLGRLAEQHVIRSAGPRILALAGRVGEVFRTKVLDRERLPDCVAVTSIDQLKALRLHGYDFGLAVASSLISHLRWPRPDFGLKRVDREYRRLWRLASQAHVLAQEVLKRAEPQEIIVFNGRYGSTRPFLRAAELLGIACRIHERGANFRRFQLYDFPPHHVDRLGAYVRERASCVDDAMIREEGTRFFRMRRSGAEQSWTSFVKGQQKGRLVENLPPGFVTFFSSSDDEFEAISEKAARGPFGNQRETVETLRSVCRRLGLPLVIRLHPNLATIHPKEAAYWLALADGRDVIVVPPDSATDTYALLERSSAVVSYGTTVGMEATFWQKPSILLGPAVYRGSGVCYEPATPQELQSLLSTQVPPRETFPALMFGWYFQTFGEPYRYYQPEDLFHGRFMGVKVFEQSLILKGLLRVKAGLRVALSLVRGRSMSCISTRAE